MALYPFKALWTTVRPTLSNTSPYSAWGSMFVICSVRSRSKCEHSHSQYLRRVHLEDAVEREWVVCFVVVDDAANRGRVGRRQVEGQALI